MKDKKEEVNELQNRVAGSEDELLQIREDAEELEAIVVLMVVDHFQRLYQVFMDRDYSARETYTVLESNDELTT